MDFDKLVDLVLDTYYSVRNIDMERDDKLGSAGFIISFIPHDWRSRLGFRSCV